ncbi:MAG: biotin--[Neisseriaceae bacterium]|nr:biotin--[acetyl-CoA-carboxylase] ligase [Neisseriaceae bacterium]
MKFSEMMLKELENRFNFPVEIHYVDETTSTNTVLKQMAADGAKDGTVYLAARQTQGRGRMGRSFFSPDGGLYFSMLFRPKMNPATSLLLTVAAAVAVAEAMDEVFDTQSKIKWVNDVYVNGKKVCGILAESQLDPSKPTEQAVIVGIGINVCAPKDGFPTEIENRAGALCETNEAVSDQAV